VDGSLQNDLISGEGGIVSAEPARRLQELARLAAADEALATTLATASLPAIQAALTASGAHQLRDGYQQYLDKFSDRCLDELKLESATLADDPLLLLRSIGRLALAEGRRASEPPSAAPAGESPRARAEARVSKALGLNLLRRAIFGVVLRQARTRVRHRENLRFERTRVFGRVRRIFVEAGKRLAAEGRLVQPGDVFHLQVDEVLGIVEGTASTGDLAALAGVRAREYAGYRTMEAPSDRFETRGAVWVGNRFQQAEAAASLGDDQRRGIGCCPGIVEGRARLVTDPRDALLEPGDILVAERTDPGWILLFPSASAVVVERGSVLSHSAIVARELGLPAVVSLPGLMSWLRDGDAISVDGTTGLVRRLTPGAPTS
jgi:pyruvate,water dikinase